jgi:O-antigen ligase
VGEITDMKNGFFRVFIQSQIFELVAIFILVLFIAYLFNLPRTKDAMNRVSTAVRKNLVFYSSLLFISCFAIVLGLSRSFWAAGFGTGFFLIGFMIFRFRLKWKAIIASLSLLAIAGVASVGIVNYALGAKVNNRVNASDPAASSRWKMLPPLMSAIKVRPIIGSGLGKTITYQSDDPRFKNEKNPEGWLTTYALEWGYLDFILKFGIIGTGLYLWFLGYVAWEGWKLTKISPPLPEMGLGGEGVIIAGGFLLGLIAVYATHMLSPYLNHPLGIGYVMVSVGVFRGLKSSSKSLIVTH